MNWIWGISAAAAVVESLGSSCPLAAKVNVKLIRSIPKSAIGVESFFAPCASYACNCHFELIRDSSERNRAMDPLPFLSR